MWFCQNTANNVLSRFVEFLSNTGGYIDSVLFCQSLQSCLTEHFWCLTEILSRARFVWQNIPKMFKNQKSLLISGMNQYFEKSPWQKLQNHISQLLSGGFYKSFSYDDVHQAPSCRVNWPGLIKMSPGLSKRTSRKGTNHGLTKGRQPEARNLDSSDQIHPGFPPLN